MQDVKEPAGKSSNVKDEPNMCEKEKEKPSSEGQYYYDDAHGYEDFDPGAADEDDVSATDR